MCIGCVKVSIQGKWGRFYFIPRFLCNILGHRREQWVDEFPDLFVCVRCGEQVEN
jgi:hypothetical protein